jgi:hypothetical protein
MITFQAPARSTGMVFVAVGTLIGELGPAFTPKQEFYCLFRNKWLFPVEGASSDLSDEPYHLTKLSWVETDVREPSDPLEEEAKEAGSN